MSVSHFTNQVESILAYVLNKFGLCKERPTAMFDNIRHKSIQLIFIKTKKRFSALFVLSNHTDK